MRLESFLKTKGAEYASFDPQRAPRILEKLQIYSNKNQIVIHIIGTNGKGSTGRFLSLMLRELGFSVGHFTSPHLFNLNERFWLNGKLVSENALNEAFASLEFAALKEASYFEVLTFLAKVVFRDCEILVLEAGLGGKFDSTTTCFNANLSLFTSIGFDHEAFLGNTIQEIASTKLKAMAKEAILGFQNDNLEEIVKIAKEIATIKKANLEILTKIPQEILDYINKKEYAFFQAQNLSLAYFALEKLQKIFANKFINFPHFTLKTLLESLPSLDLKGRMQRVAKNIICDVMHNVDGAKTILKQLQNSDFSQNKTILIYNSYFDKNPKEILRLLKPQIKCVEILNIENPRIIKKENLTRILKELEIPSCDFKEIKENENYLVCGSFSVVAEFLKQCQ